MWLIKTSVLGYANQWFRTDREFLETLREDGGINPMVLERLAAKYMVARGFKEEGYPQRWKIAAEFLKKHSCSSKPIADRVESLALDLGEVAPKNERKPAKLLSAATKFLWFSGDFEVRILDKRAVESLRAMGNYSRNIGNDYEQYAIAWGDQFDFYKKEIRKAMRELPGVFDWSMIDPQFRQSVKEVIKQDFFADRVFDKYLWTKGESINGGLTSFA